MNGFSHQLFMVPENGTKLIVEPEKLVLMLSTQYGCFFPVRFSSYGILHHMGDAQVFYSVSHSMGKCSKTHQIMKVWEIGSHTFFIAWVLFSIRFQSSGRLHHMGNGEVSQSISHSTGKCDKAHCKGITWEIGTRTFSIAWGCFMVWGVLFPYYGILHHMGNTWIFSSISHSMGKCSKTH